MKVSRNPFVAGEGLPLMLALAAAVVIILRYYDPWYAAIPALLFALLYFVFRDPVRNVPPVALGIVSPVDGVVESIEETDRCVVQGEAYRIRIRIDALGTYTARSPVEGRVMDLHSRAEGVGPECPANALWVRTDEGDDVVLQFEGYRLGLAPRSFVRFGERVGLGERCAYLRLARYANLSMPKAGRVQVTPGQRVLAGSDLIGLVPHP